jgi:hypothetical protein
MTETTHPYYMATIGARDCDEDPATVEVVASPSEFGSDIELQVTAWDRIATAYLTPEQVGVLIDKLTSAVGYATATSDSGH